MHIEIVQDGQVLRTIRHKGQTYVKAPKGGAYTLRIRNPYNKRRLAIVSVDGINVVDGETAGHDGPGYVVEPFQTVDIPGFRRSDDTVAAFEFSAEGESYSAQTGRGTKNVGVIGLAVFDEKVVHEHHHHHHWNNGWTWPEEPRYGKDPNFVGTTFTSTGPAQGGIIRSHSLGLDDDPIAETNYFSCAACCCEKSPVEDVGTKYGSEVNFYTTETSFTRATDSPVLVRTLRYATRARLESWGVPLKPMSGPEAPQAFPASSPSCPAPAGWRG